ncbi:hypothetical protein Lesp02_35240 [Lentzea sp. NBRC 105346]|uniref:TOMM precursor leader peptide-binding protein n=1 Tax=Lentzea sp. NBRC 105346 TaxID=3032205 RepID=UPI0024A2EF13|nr:TOMM precursor leader peptide-binding protein [Lentzea sp. NBRC 105346]GLZ31336.1 hypothetical protein Lesp02_35240 [Lentzea sp. NBRC 105346]
MTIVWADGDAVLIRPQGCPTCARRRRGDTEPARGVTLPFVRRAIDAIACGTTESVVRVDLRTARTTTHHVLPDPLCPDCAPPLSAHPKRIVLQPRKCTGLRVHELDRERLRATYVDACTGLVRSVRTTTAGGVPLAEAELASGRRAHGRTGDAESSWTTAIAEALERHGSSWPPRGQGLVRAAAADIEAFVPEPYPDDRYDLPGFPRRRFDPRREIDWVWGYSFGRGKPVLVPASVAYPDGAVEAFVQETSSGCAVGGCLEEAILHALLEIAERDAALRTWYGRQTVPRVDFNVDVPGYRVVVFDITQRQGVPSFWTMAVDRTPSPVRWHTLCTTNAHLDPRQAIEGALVELVTLLDVLPRTYDPVAAKRLLDDPRLVRELPDHSLRYAHVDAFDRFSFLDLDADPVPLPDGWPPRADLTEHLTDLIDRFGEVVVVDQTSSEHRAADLCCVKVFVPEALPMTFGHDFRRHDGEPHPFP